MNDKELYLLAKETLKNAYAPYSKFHVGAALLTKDGAVYTGVNIENSSYPAGICAERTAFAKAISEGVRDFEAVAVASSGGTAWPCGICRQFMFEFNDELRIITGDDENHLITYSLKELLLEGFRLEHS